MFTSSCAYTFLPLVVCLDRPSGGLSSQSYNIHLCHVFSFQGFLQWNWDGGPPSRLDVDTLNEKLKQTGAMRLRHAHKPDEAFGLIFNFDTVVADTRGALNHAWKDLADAREHKIPAHARLNAHHMCTERIIMDVLNWTRNLKQAREMSYELAMHYSKHLELLESPQPGTGEQSC